MTFTPTAKCPLRAPHMTPHLHPMPLPDLDNNDIDLALCHMVDSGLSRVDIPTTQYGRRYAVLAYLKFEQITPIFGYHRSWTPQHPTQPR